MKKVWHVVTEAAFIVFLFYSNLLMGEFEHSGLGHTRGIQWALWNVLTLDNFIIAILAAFIGTAVVEFLRKGLGERSVAVPDVKGG